MRHQPILMWIKVHCYQNTFNGLEFSNIKIFNQKIHFLNFWKGKNFKIISEIRTHMTNRFVVNPLTNIAFTVAFNMQET